MDSPVYDRYEWKAVHLTGNGIFIARIPFLSVFSHRSMDIGETEIYS